MTRTSDERFAGKTALITGGTKGLGLAVAESFARAGANVIVTYRSDDAGASKAGVTLRALGARCELIKCDLSEDGGAEALWQAARAKTSRLDFYVHNAAATAFKDLMEAKSHHIDKTFNLTIKSFILGMQHAAPLMQPGSAVVTVSGMDTLRAVPRHGLLGIAKSGLETMTGYFAHELAPRGIRVNGVNPGFLDTDSTRKYLGPMFDMVKEAFAQMSPLKRDPTLAEVANVILFLCSEESSWIVGQTINVDGGQDFALPFGG